MEYLIRRGRHASCVHAGGLSCFTFVSSVESEKLAQDLQKVEQLESKITSELDQLKERIRTMGEEIEVYSDIDKLRSDAEARKQVSGLIGDTVL